MRISEEYKKTGYFWLPATPDEKIPGIITIIDGGEASVEIIGNFGDPFNDNDTIDMIRIIGHVENDGYITLENCFYKNKNYSFGGISKSLIHVNTVLSGVAYDENEKVEFDSIQFSVEGLEDWVGISGITVINDKDYQGATVTFAPPDPLVFLLKNGMELKIAFGNSRPLASKPKDLHITQHTYFKLTSPESKTLDELTYITHKLTNLMCFALDMTVSMKNIYCFSNSIQKEIESEKSKPIPIKLYYQSSPFSEKIPTPTIHKMLFRFVDVQHTFKDLVDNWLNAYETISPTLNLYFANRIGAHKFLEGKFLSLAQALETYHRRTSDETLMSKSDYQKLLLEVKKGCPEKHKDWLSQRLDFGNEISFRTRLNRIIDTFKKHVGTEDEITEVISQIVNTRNYLTHYDPKLEKKAVLGINLWYLQTRMEAFLQLHLLKQLGFGESEINSVLDKTYQFKNKLTKSANS